MKQRELIPRTLDLDRRQFTRREVAGIRQTLDELGSARCPLCRSMLVARQGRKGPVFFCRYATEPRRVSVPN